ncbi:MAG: hypothetical protein ACREBG_19685 [Pyrinomonadaceae bacterium]
MRKTFLFVQAISILSYLSFSPAAHAQSTDVPKFELGAEFSSLAREDLSGHRGEVGLGGRFTFNLNRNVAIEAAGYFFPDACFSCEHNGRVIEGLFGVKAGKRFQTWGLFAKGRPGFVSYSLGEFNIVPLGTPGPFPFRLEINRTTHFALDLGAVVEFYPSKRIVARFDAGDTLIHYVRRTTNFLSVDPSTGDFILNPFTRPAHTRHNFQFTAGVGFRF